MLVQVQPLLTNMTNHIPNSPWLFVIDTADFAGNFERDLCAFITGRVGDCGVGDEMSKLFMSQVKKSDEYLFANVTTEPDDNGCHRPVTIYKNKDDKYHSVAIFFDEKPTKWQIQLMKERSEQFANMPNKWKTGSNRISKILGFRLIKNIITRTTKEEIV